MERKQKHKNSESTRDPSTLVNQVLATLSGDQHPHDLGTCRKFGISAPTPGHKSARWSTGPLNGRGLQGGTVLGWTPGLRQRCRLIRPLSPGAAGRGRPPLSRFCQACDGGAGVTSVCVLGQSPTVHGASRGNASEKNWKCGASGHTLPSTGPAPFTAASPAPAPSCGLGSPCLRTGRGNAHGKAEQSCSHRDPRR